MKSSMPRKQVMVRTPVGKKTKRGAELEGTPKTPRAMESSILVSPATSRSVSVERICLLQEVELSNFPSSRTRRPLHWSVNAKQGLIALPANHHHHQQQLFHDAGISTPLVCPSVKRNRNQDQSLQYSASASSPAQLVCKTSIQQRPDGDPPSIKAVSSSFPSPSSATASAAALSPICLNAISPATVNDQEQGHSCRSRLKRQCQPNPFYSAQLGPEWRRSSRTSNQSVPSLSRNERVFVWSNAAFDQNIPMETADYTTSINRAVSTSSYCSSLSSSSVLMVETDPDSGTEEGDSSSHSESCHITSVTDEGEMNQHEGGFTDSSLPEDVTCAATTHSGKMNCLQQQLDHVMVSEAEAANDEPNLLTSIEPVHEKVTLADIHDASAALEGSGNQVRQKSWNKEHNEEVETSMGKDVLIQEIDAEIKVLTSRLTELQMQKQKWEGEVMKKMKQNTEISRQDDNSEGGSRDATLTNCGSSIVVTKKEKLVSVPGVNKLEFSPLPSKAAETTDEQSRTQMTKIRSDGVLGEVQRTSSFGSGVGSDHDQRGKSYRRLSLSTTASDGTRVLMTRKQGEKQRGASVQNAMASSERNITTTTTPGSSTIATTPSRVVTSRYNDVRPVTPRSQLASQKSLLSPSISSASVGISASAIANKKRDWTSCRSAASSSNTNSAASIAMLRSAELSVSPVVKRAVTTRSGCPSRSGFTTMIKSVSPPRSSASLIGTSDIHLTDSASFRKQTTIPRSTNGSSSSRHGQHKQQQTINTNPKSTAALYQCLESLVEDSKNFFKRISPVRSRSSSSSSSSSSITAAAAASQNQPSPSTPLPCIYTCRSSSSTATSRASHSVKIQSRGMSSSFFAEERSFINSIRAE